jgi:hypothetical protein
MRSNHERESMNTNYNRVRTQFAPETRFEVTPVPSVPFRGVRETELERLKNRLLLQLLNETARPEFNALFRRAANEAAGLAWLTPYPALVFPGLFEEKARAALGRGLHQEQVRQRSLELLAETV